MSEDPRQEVIRLVQQCMEAAGQAIAEWAERMRPAFEQLTEIARNPEVAAAFERVPNPAGGLACFCLCTRHPDDKGVCDGEAVTTREFISGAFGPVHVPLCAPCAVAQGISEGIPG